jgi:hypothetical protein
MGSFKDNQVATFVSTPGMATVMPSDFVDGILPPSNMVVPVSSLRSLKPTAFHFKPY